MRRSAAAAMGGRMAWTVGVVVAAWAALGWAATARAEELIRVATYNIKFFETPRASWTAAKAVNHATRLASLREVLGELDAHVIGLQEIDNRAALRQVFPADEWAIVIDDDSGDDQDVALAVRRDVLEIVAHPGASDVDAEDADFLFPGSANNTFFPNRRDVLAVELEVERTGTRFVAMVVHGKSRYEGRETTEARRVGGAVELMRRLDQQFDGARVVLVGDFNDNPDDRSMNVLETGDPNAAGGEEDEEGAFMINLAEPLLAAGHVSHGLNSADIDQVGQVVVTVDAASRGRNNAGRGTDVHTGDILFDQILISPALSVAYVQGSAAVFDGVCAVRGNGDTRASDHVPVFAELVFAQTGPEPVEGGVEIVGVMPDPVGVDVRHERVVLRSAAAVDLAGWYLLDRAETKFDLSGTLAAGVERVVVLDPASMMLNNSGDEVRLFDGDGRLIDEFGYEGGQVVEGAEIR